MDVNYFIINCIIPMLENIQKPTIFGCLGEFRTRKGFKKVHFEQGHTELVISLQFELNVVI